MRLDLYRNGVCLDMGTPYQDNPSREKKKAKKGGGKRKKLTGKFSAASFRRMREFCITHDCPLDCWGVTLTVPGTILENSVFKSILHKLSVFCNYRAIPIVWRCELQQRGQPHLHLVAYGDCMNICLIMIQWQSLISKLGNVYNVEFCGEEKEIVSINRAFVNGSSHMFEVERLKGDFRSWRYLVAHASKGKLAQAGWSGRQWGVVYRKVMLSSCPESIELEDREMYALRRWVRRASSRRIGKYGKHFVLVSPNDLQRMVSYLRNDYFGAPF